MTKGNVSISGIILILVVIMVLAIVVLVFTGFITLPLSLNEDDQGDVKKPIGSEYCGFTDGEIIDMYENLVGKDLNNDVGFSVINALNMRACGTNSKIPGEIIGEYTIEFADGWYVLGDDTETKTGYYYRIVVWGNAPTLTDSSLIRVVVSGNGMVIEEWYGYETLTITSYGTKSGYMAAVLWLS